MIRLYINISICSSEPQRACFLGRFISFPSRATICTQFSWQSCSFRGVPGTNTEMPTTRGNPLDFLRKVIPTNILSQGDLTCTFRHGLHRGDRRNRDKIEENKHNLNLHSGGRRIVCGSFFSLKAPLEFSPGNKDNPTEYRNTISWDPFCLPAEKCYLLWRDFVSLLLSLVRIEVNVELTCGEQCGEGIRREIRIFLWGFSSLVTTYLKACAPE